jgi:hypothetical protein
MLLGENIEMCTSYDYRAVHFKLCFTVLKCTAVLVLIMIMCFELQVHL